MKTYKLRVEFAPEEDGWSACCPALKDNGGFTWAHTKEKAHEHIVRTLEIVTGSMIESGLSIPEEPKDAPPLEQSQFFVAIQPKPKPPPRPVHLMKTYRFLVQMEPDEDVWFVRCPTLERYGAATWGETQEQARKHIQEVLGMVLETMLEEGIPIPEESEDVSLEGDCLVVTI